MSEEETIATLEGMKDGYSFRECELCEDDCTTCKCVELVAIETMLDLYNKEKEKNKEAEKQGYKKGSDTANKIWIHRIEYLKLFREFQLQQEYKEFEDDIEWQTYNNLLEELR